MPRLNSYALGLALVLALGQATFAQQANAPAQAAAEDTKQLDAVSQEAAKLEADLNKFKDTAPEAAEVLVKLVDLYHQHGRAFGLIRAGQRFSAAHPNDPRNQAVMLKLIDGLEAMSRHKELTVSIRQFLQKYPQAPQAAELEERLAKTLDKLGERQKAGETWRALWNRQPNVNGRKFGEYAVTRFNNGNQNEIFEGCVLAEEMLDKLPAGEFTKLIAGNAHYRWRQYGQWAKANTLGAKMLAKGLPYTPEEVRELHRMQGDQFGYLSQHANAANHYRQARAIRDDWQVLKSLIYSMYYSQAKAAEFEPLVNEFDAKFPDREERFDARALLATAIIRDGDKARGSEMIKPLLAFNPYMHSIASVFVQNAGTEPAQFQAAEAVLRDALAKNPKYNAYYLRHSIALEICRDRLKDDAKAKAMCREFLDQVPGNDGHSWNVLSHLLFQATNDAEFQQDVQRYLAARKRNLHMTTFIQYLQSYIDQAKGNKDLVERVKYAQAELKKQNDDPLVALYLKWTHNIYHAPDAQIRTALRQTHLAALPEPMWEQLMAEDAYYYRHVPPQVKTREESARTYLLLAQRFPKNRSYLDEALSSVSDYGPIEISKQIFDLFVAQEPVMNNGDQWRRLMIIADQHKDASLCKRTLEYVQKSQAKFGKEGAYSSTIGDALMRHKLEAEGLAYYQFGRTQDRQIGDSAECASRLFTLLKTPDERIAFSNEMLQTNTPYNTRYAQWAAMAYFEKGDIDSVERVTRDTLTKQQEKAFQPANWDATNWYNMSYYTRTPQDKTKELPQPVKQRIFALVRDVNFDWGSSQAQIFHLENMTPAELAQVTPMKRLLIIADAARKLPADSYRWDMLMTVAQQQVAAKDYVSAATLITGLLTNIPNVDEPRKATARNLVSQCYTRIGAVGLTIDEKSPIAPLLQAAMYLRLGDERLAIEAYTANKKLFDDHRDEVPVDLVMFVCQNLMAAGGNDNFEKVEDTLRSWLIKNDMSTAFDAPTKAGVQLLLAKNFFNAQRYDVARSEYTTVINRFPNTPYSTEAEFGIGETFMAQKVYDQAEAVFEKLATSREADVVVRAEFLRGVLAHRRGDQDEARSIFRNVLDRVPNIELANQALFNLAEVYGSEERYMDQLNLLRTVGRLGRSSKRFHAPGQALSIVVQDSDLGISRGHNKIPVIVKTIPGGDEEIVYLTSGGAGKGLFRTDLETALGQVKKRDKILQLTGKDQIKCDYPDEFKKEFKSVPLSDVEIKIASNAKFEVASQKIVDEKEETFSEKLAREELEKDREQNRRTQQRPKNHVKPGNQIFLKVTDPDRDLTDEPDTVMVKLVADSGDQVQVPVKETGPHTGIFEGTAQTGELPAGALASDTSIDHSPLMAIDKKKESYWLSEPDGAVPKLLTIDMKDLNAVNRVKVWSPKPDTQIPIRGDLLGSNDGEFWFRLASHPEPLKAEKLFDEYKAMRRRVYAGNFTGYTTWDQIKNLAKSNKPSEEEDVVNGLEWSRKEDADDAKTPFGVLWFGKLVQPKAGAARIQIQGVTTALAIDGTLEMPLGPGNRTVDVWLEKGLHDVTIFAAVNQATQISQAIWARADINRQQVVLGPFLKSDFDLEQAEAREVVQPAAVAPVEIPLTLETIKLTKKTEQFGIVKERNPAQIGYWQNLDDLAAWEFEAAQPGVYDAYLEIAHAGGGSTFDLTCADTTIKATVPNTGAWTTAQMVKFGTVIIDKAGKQTLSIKPTLINNTYLMEVRSAKLVASLDARVVQTPGAWEFRFPSNDLRYVRFKINEYLGDAVAVNHVEVSGRGSAHKEGEKEKADAKAVASNGDPLYIPTDADVLELSSNNTLEIAGGDVVSAGYTDEFTQNENTSSLLLTEKLFATYFNATVGAINYDFIRLDNGQVQNIEKTVVRVDPGERFVVSITDFDMDTTIGQDTLEFEVSVNDGAPIKLSAIERELTFSGTFTKEIDTMLAGTADAANDNSDSKLKVKPGDRIVVKYLDAQNTFPGHSVKREAVVYVNKPTAAQIRIVETRVIPGNPKQNVGPQTVYLPQKDAKDKKDVANVAFEAPLTIEVVDPDMAKDSRSEVLVTLETTDGAKIECRCVVSGQHSHFNQYQVQDADHWALEEGRFLGQVILQLGSKASADVIPLTSDMPRNLIGGGKLDESQTGSGRDRSLVTRVLNLTGKDKIIATYTDEKTPNAKPRTSAVSAVSSGAVTSTPKPAATTPGSKPAMTKNDPKGTTGTAKTGTPKTGAGTPAPAQPAAPAKPEVATVSAQARLISNGVLAVVDRDYDKPIQQLHVGEKLYLMVTDADQDASDERDYVAVEITTEFGEKETVKLEETLAHSGVFTGSLQLKSNEKPTPGNLSADAPVIECYFGDTVKVRYVDPAASSEDGKLELEKSIPVVIGTDGLVAAFSKTFNDERLAVETKFHIAESFFELFKSHKALARKEEELADLEAGRRILQEVIEDYPDPKYVPRIRYLLGQFAQELGQWDDAIDNYEEIINHYADHLLAPDAQYKLAQCHEERGDFDAALEAYVTLAATYPKSPLISSVMIRISDHFYKAEEYTIAAQVGEKFIEKFEGHQHAPKMAFRIGQCFYKAKKFGDAGKAFDRFGKNFSDDTLAPDALFWAGESYRMGGATNEAFRRYNNCRWNHPSSEAAKFARGRLALPEMLQQFEAEANAIENQ
jgi:TolA-binding protein